jgi:hypothetical protein
MLEACLSQAGVGGVSTLIHKWNRPTLENIFAELLQKKLALNRFIVLASNIQPLTSFCCFIQSWPKLETLWRKRNNQISLTTRHSAAKLPSMQPMNKHLRLIRALAAGGRQGSVDPSHPRATLTGGVSDARTQAKHEVGRVETRFESRRLDLASSTNGNRVKDARAVIRPT